MQTQEKIPLLIVDDEIVSRSSLEALLESDEYQLFFAEDGAQGLDKAESIHPVLMILDVMMPGMNGFEVCRRLRANAKLAQIPVIMITAWDDPTAKQRCLDVGANDVICKPFNRADLQARIQKLIVTR
ncbi:response regulator with CheY-like receiver domain and winged-helix DNA-binding domain [Beggiatoa alba B18LD]|uniref:Response regulator with CheY-like receiver domain and winged-helix DNA-binding domain n=1 Tax=Beggiatoa alba B18LD TaxID=395493 RepID=I3CED4_9GAMM|nr:response regulator [Beggiatoa alba]EIJ41977.1 response regulator with CheY-like receiver domain and winged-helix DNA-binding domain [Beggiatoa alba B18LD]